MFWLFQPSASGCNMLNFFGWSIKNQLTVGKLFYSLIYYLRTQQNVQNTLTAIKPEFNYQNLTFSFDFQLQHQNIREMKLELWFWLKNIFWCNTPRWYREGLIRNSLLQCFAANNSLSFGDGSLRLNEEQRALPMQICDRMWPTSWCSWKLQSRRYSDLHTNTKT